MQLAKLIGRKIVVLGPKLLDGGQSPEKLETVTLLGVESTGIWIESEEAANRIVEKFRVRPAAPAFFIPFAQVTTILASTEAAAEPEPTPAAATENAA